MLTIENVIASMARQKTAYWVVKDAKGHIRAKNLSVENFDESEAWLLEESEHLEDGKFKIELRTHPNNSKGNVVLEFQIGDGAANMASVGRVGNPAQITRGGGIFEQFMLARIGSDDDEKRRLRDENDKLKRDLDRQKFDADRKEFKRELERVKEEMSAEPDMLDRLTGLLESRGGQKLLDKVFPGMPLAAAAIGRKKAPSGAQVDFEDPDDHTDQIEGTDGEGDLADLPLEHEAGIVSVDHMIEASQQFREIFPEWNFNILLAKIIRKAQNDPETIRNLANFL